MATLHFYFFPLITKFFFPFLSEMFLYAFYLHCTFFFLLKKKTMNRRQLLRQFSLTLISFSFPSYSQVEPTLLLSN